MSEISTLSKFAEYGLVGISLFCLIIVLIAFWIIWKLSSNHINHNTEALTLMTAKLEEDITSQKETAQTMRDLKDCIKTEKKIVL
jgi:CHASE3 domain sensor protein